MITANLNSPMDTKTAILRFSCPECKDGNDCGWNCVESATCSLRCKSCNERNWFTGNLPEHKIGKWIFTCVACGKVNKQ